MSEGTSAVLAQASALIGAVGSVVRATEPVDLSSIRRMAQAIMDPDPIYWDAERARHSAHGQIVAPPLYPLHALRTRGGAPDPLDSALTDPSFDGGGGDLLAQMGLPPLRLPFSRLLNGGNSVQVDALAVVGDEIAAQSTYLDIALKEGRSGELFFVTVSTRYWSMTRDLTLLTSEQVFIWR